MGACSSVYGWQGGANPPAPRPECSKKQHAKLIEASGKMLFDARKTAYALYSKECRAWGREPSDEESWFMHAKAAYCRLLRKDG